MAHKLMGCTVQDRIHGFKGVVTGHVTYITGCDQLLVQPAIEKKKNEVPEARWIDVSRLNVVKGTKPVSLDTSEATGPDMPAPIR